VFMTIQKDGKWVDMYLYDNISSREDCESKCQNSKMCNYYKYNDKLKKCKLSRECNLKEGKSDGYEYYKVKNKLK